MLPASNTPFSATPPPSAESFGAAKRIDVRPRLSGARAGEGGAADDAAVLHFTCPACLQMLSVPRAQASLAVVCAGCQVSVQPPQVVSASVAAGQGRTSLPPPKKSGVAAIRHG